MSVPRLLDVPRGVRRLSLTTERGTFAAFGCGPRLGQETADSPAPRNGPPLVLVPGWTGSKEDFLGLLPSLADQGRDAVALDLRGQHETPGVEDESAYAIPELARDVTAVIDSLALGPVHLVGHSFGGLVARETALLAPDRVAGLTLLCSGPAAMHPERQHLLRQMVDSIRHLGLEATWHAKRAYDATVEARRGVSSPPAAVLDFLRRRFLSNHPVSLRAITSHLVEAEDRTAELAQSGVPVQVVYGAADDGWPPEVQREMAARLGVTPIVIDGAGHSPAVEAPEATAAVLVSFPPPGLSPTSPGVQSTR